MLVKILAALPLRLLKWNENPGSNLFLLGISNPKSPSMIFSVPHRVVDEDD